MATAQDASPVFLRVPGAEGDFSLLMPSSFSSQSRCAGIQIRTVDFQLIEPMKIILLLVNWNFTKSR